MYRLLDDLRIVEGSSFVAAPSCGMHLAQLGAEVIRFDQIGGGPDFNRWPRADNGTSFFWEGLNKGKKSIALDLRQEAGRELAVALITAEGDGAGIFLTNFPAGGFLSHERLCALRRDLISVRIMGTRDGGNAVDYTVNCAVGYPFMTGPASLAEEPVNHVLPAWDLLAGAHAAFALMAAERVRQRSGSGQELRLALKDLAMATVGHLGQIAETAASGNRARHGNALFGAFGRDFITTDGRRVMIVAITARQWTNLIETLAIRPAIAALEAELSVSFAKDEGLRFQYRDRLFPIVEAAVASRPLADLAGRLEAGQVCWSPYRTLEQALDEDPDFSDANPLFERLGHTSGHNYPTPGATTFFGGCERLSPVRAPKLGEHTDEVLATVLCLPDHAIGELHDRGVVAAADRQVS